MASVAPKLVSLETAYLTLWGVCINFHPVALQQDIKSYCNLLPAFNGISFINKPLPNQENLFLHSCLLGCGAFKEDSSYSWLYAGHILEISLHHSIWNIEKGCGGHDFASELGGSVVRVYCDNLAACIMLEDGHSHADGTGWCFVPYAPQSAYHNMLGNLGWFEGKT